MERRELAVDLGHARVVVLRRRGLDERRRQAHLLHPELDRAAVGRVEGRRPRRHLVVQLGGRLVNDVDGLVRQEPRGDVAVREPGGRDQRAVQHADAVVRLELGLEAPQDGHGRLDVGLADQHLLEPPLERLVRLHVLLVLGQRRRADAGCRARRRLGFDASRAPPGADPDDRVDLVDEQDDAALRGLAPR